MKNILKKEFMLGIHPSCYITFAFVLCALIPNFPMIVVFFYPFCILPQLMMGKNQENNDFEYSTLLPLSLKDYVKGKVVVLALFELTYLLLLLPMLLLRNYVLFNNPSSPVYYLNSPGFHSIITLYGIAFIVYSFVNLIMIAYYFAKFPKYILPLLFSIFGSFLLFTLFGLVMSYFPVIGPLFDQKEGIIAQLILLFVGIVFYSGSLFLTTNLGARNLKKKL